MTRGERRERGGRVGENTADAQCDRRKEQIVFSDCLYVACMRSFLLHLYSIPMFLLLVPVWPRRPNTEKRDSFLPLLSLSSFALAWHSSVRLASTDHTSAYSQLQTIHPAIDTHAERRSHKVRSCAHSIKRCSQMKCVSISTNAHRYRPVYTSFVCPHPPYSYATRNKFIPLSVLEIDRCGSA